MFPKSGKSFDPLGIPKAIRDAGFTAPEITVTAEGTLVGGREFLEFQVPGTEPAFVLAGGSQAEALKKRGDLVGKKIRVTGKLHPNHGDQPPGLTVESFQPAS